MPIPPSTPARRPLSVGRAIGLYVIYLVAFVFGGGLGAGLPTLAFEGITGRGYETEVLYAVMFGVTGFIAYRLAQRVAEGGDGH